MIEERVRNETALIYRLLIDDDTKEVEAIMVATTLLPEDRAWLEAQYPGYAWVEGDVFGVNKRKETVRELFLAAPGKDLAVLKKKHNPKIPWSLPT